MTEYSSEDKIFLGKQKVIQPRMEPFVLVVLSTADVWLIKSKPLTRDREQVIAGRGVAKILPLVFFTIW